MIPGGSCNAEDAAYEGAGWDATASNISGMVGDAYGAFDCWNCGACVGACAGACAECDAKSYCPFAGNDDFIPVPFYHGCGFDDDEDDDEDEEGEVADDVY